MSSTFASKRIKDLFKVKSGDFHAAQKELDPGLIPLISCGDTDNGLVDYFNIPLEKTYQRCLTVAYNGLPLTTKYHPYRFGAKDDVAVLIPCKPLKDTTLFYIAALLNRRTWRYSYGRKCFREKLRNVRINVPVTNSDSEEEVIDEDYITNLYPKDFSFTELILICRSLRIFSL